MSKASNLSEKSEHSELSVASDDSDSTQMSNYTKVSHEEHVMLAPDTYVGSIDPEEEDYYVMEHLDDVSQAESVDSTEAGAESTEATADKLKQIKIVSKTIKVVPAFYKIFDEVLVNAEDQVSRLKSYKEQGKPVKHQVSTIKINLNQESGEITIWNDGEGIEIYLLEEHNLYPPELIFGTLLTGSNYDKSEDKTVGGKNGYGAKLANIFSKTFRVETVDAHRKKRFVQTFSNNMKDRTTPEITDFSGKPYTTISFLPDYEKFSMTGMDDDVYALFEKRAYDVAAWTPKNISVYFNDKKIPIKQFEQYVDLYLGSKTDRPRVYEQLNDRWEVVASFSEDDAFQQVSFVNGICTKRGGKHVEAIADQIKDSLCDMIRKKKKVEVKPALVKNQLFLFVKATIVNPSFDSQTKETLTTAKKNFGSNCPISEKFIEKLYKTPIVEKIIAEAEYKNSKASKKNDGKKQRKLVGIPKLCDANKAGTSESKRCTLILTEGDSAKTTAISGLSIVGRDHFGVFPLRGKLLNVKDIDIKKVEKNEEINNLKKILGLKRNEVYDKPKHESSWPLRYGKILIMTDQDLDGSHIKGLVMNLFHTSWPSLLPQEFLMSMVTPIVKVFKGKSSKAFYSLQDYQDWKEGGETKGWRVKYYKGLGTSSTDEAKQYFKDLHTQTYSFTEDQSDSALNLAFDKKLAKSRKDWLESYDGNDVLDFNKKKIPFEEFIHRDLKHFSHADCLRSIPSSVDGLKPSQRKIVYAAFKRKLKSEIKVAQLAGYVSENASYHHGEQSLMGAITNLAQNFVCSNNLNILYPSGQFGTRLMGGQDAASPRYIFTRLEEWSHLIFPEKDMPILNYLNDDGFTIEPDIYYPILPMVLVNGSRGIGTGYSCNVPCHSPLEIIQQLLNKMEGKPVNDLVPFYQDFKGEIKEEGGKFVAHGDYLMTGKKSIVVKELPVGTWTQQYKEFLDANVKDRSNDRSKPFLKSFDDYCTESSVEFRLQFIEDLSDWTHTKIMKTLKLTSSRETSTSNMFLYDRHHKLKKFQSATEILDDFYEARLEMYVKRREYWLNELRKEADILEDKVKFIRGLIKGEIDLRAKAKVVVDEELLAYGLRRVYPNADSEPTFDYLTSMAMHMMTKEKAEELEKKCQDKLKELQDLEDTSPQTIWAGELKELKDVITKYLLKKTKKLVADAKKGTKKKSKK